jgi:hypothetical protein
VDAETKESTRKTEEKWMEGIRKAINTYATHNALKPVPTLPR